MRSLFSLLVAVFTVAAAGPLGKDSPAPIPAATHAPRARALLSPRALRRARLLIQLRMLELREERLDCLRAAILRRLPPDLRPTGSVASTVKQSDAARATSESEDCTWVSMQRKRLKPAA